MIDKMNPSLFVISPCFLNNINESISTHYKMLYLFIEHDNLNLAIDKNNKLLSEYEQIAIKRKDISIMGWLKTMSKLPTSFKTIVDIDKEINDNEELCLYICKHIVDKKKPLIVWDRQDYSHHSFNENNEIEYCDCLVWFLNWSELNHVLETPKQIYINSGNGTLVGGDVSDSKVENKIKK